MKPGPSSPESPRRSTVKDYQRLWTNFTNAKREGAAVQALTEILTDEEGRGFISSLDREDAESCIEVLHRGISKHKLKIAERQRFLVALGELAACHGRLPESMIIAENIDVEVVVLASGGFADVRFGVCGGHRVAVKALRVSLLDDVSKIRKGFCEEVIIWSTLSHPNVLKLSGVYGDMEKSQFITVSEWMEHGNVMEYIRCHHVNRLELLHGAAQGLEYLHGAGLIHGDLKGANILMSNDTPPRACLTDFGFTKTAINSDHPISCSEGTEGGTITFMSPELMAPQKFGIRNPSCTPQSDVYAFGLVIFQVLTGDVPFRNVGPTGIIFGVVEGLRPYKPNDAPAIGFSDPLWAFTQRCWDADMKLRPEVVEVVTHLSEAAANWNGVMSPHSGVGYLATVSQEPNSDSRKHYEIFEGSPATTLEEDTTGLQLTAAMSGNQGPLASQSCPEHLSLPLLDSSSGSRWGQTKSQIVRTSTRTKAALIQFRETMRRSCRSSPSQTTHKPLPKIQN